MNESPCAAESLYKSQGEGSPKSCFLPTIQRAPTARLDASIGSCCYHRPLLDRKHPSHAAMPPPAPSSAGSLLHPTFSSAPFFFDRAALLGVSGKGGVVAEYAGGGAAGGNGDTSGSFLEGESWRGGFSGGSAVGVRVATLDGLIRAIRPF